eukprot:806534_1
MYANPAEHKIGTSHSKTATNTGGVGMTLLAVARAIVTLVFSVFDVSALIVCLAVVIFESKSVFFDVSALIVCLAVVIFESKSGRRACWCACWFCRPISRLRREMVLVDFKSAFSFSRT